MIRYFLPLILLTSCMQESDLPEEGEVPNETNEEGKVDAEQAALDAIIEARMGEIDLVDVQKYDPRILVDLKYASEDNFMHQILYDTLRFVYLQREVAERLSRVQDALDSLHPGYRLLVYDGVRPRQVQKEMWDALDSIPTIRWGEFVSNPAQGSVHNYGAAVDLTITDASGRPLDMGAAYDEFREIAFPSHEGRFLASGELSKAQVQNRQLLRSIMRSQGFSNIPSEWWHFNACSRVTAAHKYQLLETESGDARWFRIAPSTEVQSDSLNMPEYSE